MLTKARQVVPPSLWDRARGLAEAGGVALQKRSPKEETWLVRVPPRAAPYEVTWWPTDSDWYCDCEQKACAHFAAAAIARQAGTFTQRVAGRVQWRLSRSPEGLRLGFAAAADAVWTDDDRLVQRLAREWLVSTTGEGSPIVPRLILMDVLAALKGLDLTLDGSAVQADGAPVLPRALVIDHDGGWKVHLVAASGIDEAFRNGVVRMGTVLRPFTDGGLDVELKNRLKSGLIYKASDAEELLTRFLPRVEKLIPVERRSARLPRVVSVPPRIEWEVTASRSAVGGESALAVTPQIVYGDPPIARLKHGALVRIGGDLPARDIPAERKLEAELGEMRMAPGSGSARLGQEAARWVEGLKPAVRALVLEKAPQFRIERAAGDPSITIGDDADAAVVGARGFDLQIDAAGADPRALLAAWQEHVSLVPLLEGGFRPVPREWLDRYGPLLAELLDARGRDGKVARARAAVLIDAAEALALPIPPALAALKALSGDFDAVPAAALHPGFVGVLRPYQQRGLDWLTWLATLAERGGGVLADDMGLGKTIQCLAALLARKKLGPALVVAPTSVLRNWATEAARFAPELRVNVYHGPKRVLDLEADVTVTTWALLRLDVEVLSGDGKRGGGEWATLILDEAQAMKNPDSQAAEAACRVPAALKLCVTGTPVENRLEELWSLFHCVQPGLLGSRASFRDRFGAPIMNGSKRARDDLRKRVRPFVLRRLKVNVAKDLPQRTDRVLRCTLSGEERAIYESVRSLTRADVAKMLGGGRTLQVLEVLLRMRQAACHTGLLPGRSAESSGKVDMLLGALEDLGIGDAPDATDEADEADGAARVVGHKALVFSQWTSMLDLIEPHLRARGIPFVRLDGSTIDRAAVVASFQASDGPPVFLLSLTAGGTGLNLVAADYVFLMDPWWNPAVEDQATDRAHRIGQTRPVVATRLVAEGTVEERILELQSRKRLLAAAALDDEALAGQLTRDEISALFD
ncbi:MAG: DEAD/DEAH box helicase [Myxococcales bacterium]|nr:DEAD/DEAH box helicase [Myxococcales bacterium]